MEKVEQARNEFNMRDADSREDQLILLILKKMNSVYSGRLLKFVEILSLPVIIIVLAAVTVYVIRNKLNLYILLVPLGLLSIYVPSTISNFKACRQNSGIKHNIKKCGEHFLIGHATCTGKNKVTSYLGSNKYLLTAKLRDGKSLQNVLVFEPYYNDIKVGGEFALVMSSSECAEQLFAIPKKVLQPSSGKNGQEVGQVQLITEDSLRPLSEADRKVALDFGIYRTKLRRKYYGVAYLVCAIFSVALFVVTVALNSDYINLSIVILCCLAAAIVMYIFEWRQFKKMLSGTGDKLKCLDGRVSLKTAGNNKKYIEIEDLKGRRVYQSTAQEDYRIFEKGDPVLLIYQEGKDKPIICMKSLPSA